ncbi:hypothetical protein ACQKRQ_34235 [Paraburkholderia sp. NPDC080076]|uniref:hypothetical protein n=1 Tax=Paraburkholderia sp. NPDC080076 TaxID=3390605 RepID=UPI003CFD7585
MPAVKSKNETKTPSHAGMPDWMRSAVLGVFGVVIIAFDYAVGYAYYNAYLEYFNIDSHTFPLDREAYLIEGPAAIFSIGRTAFDWLLSRLDVVALVVAPLLVVWVMFSIWRYLRRDVAKAVLTSPFLQKVHANLNPPKRSYVTLILEAFNLGISAIGLLIVLMYVIGILVSLPWQIGRLAGIRDAETTQRDLDRGCDHPGIVCTAVVKDGIELGRGIRLAQSKDRIALYVNHAAREYELTGKELHTVVAPPLKDLSKLIH